MIVLENIMGRLGLRGVGEKLLAHLKQNLILVCLAMFHLSVVVFTIPYAMNYDFCSDYYKTFPTTQFSNWLTVVMGVTIALSLIVWFYLYYIPCVWRKSSKFVKACFIFLISSYGLYVFGAYPSTLLLDGDYTALYDMASHGIPIFWQSYLTSVIYLAYYLVFCHPLSIVFMEAFICCVAYTYVVDTCIKLLPLESKNRKTYCLLFGVALVLMLLVTRIAHLPLLPHRIFFWGAYAIYHVTTIFSCILRKDTSFIGTGRYCIQSILAGILAFWRTESILFLVWMYISLFIIWNKERKRESYTAAAVSVKVKKIVAGFLLSVFVCGLVYIPQIVVNSKYYRSDYMLVNYTGYMQELLTVLEPDLSYDGAEDDLACIESFTSLDMIRDFGSGAYHYSCEQLTGNCTVSGLGDLEREKYVGAIKNIIRHNPIAFFKSRIIVFLRTNSYITSKPTSGYGDSDGDGNAYYYYDNYLTGYGDYFYAVAKQLRSFGFKPVFVSRMLKASCKDIVAAGPFSCGFWMLLLLVVEILLILLSVGNIIFSKVTSLSVKDISVRGIAEWICRVAWWFLVPLAGAFTFFFYCLVIKLTGRAYDILQPYMDTVLLMLSLVLFSLNLVRKEWATVLTYLFLYVCCFMVFIFAPTAYWVYYTSLYNCIFFVVFMNLSYYYRTSF